MCVQELTCKSGIHETCKTHASESMLCVCTFVRLYTHVHVQCTFALHVHVVYSVIIACFNSY